MQDQQHSRDHDSSSPDAGGETRPARGGETGTTRVGMEGSDTDGAGTGGIVEKEDAGGDEPAGEGTSSGVTR